MGLTQAKDDEAPLIEQIRRYALNTLQPEESKWESDATHAPKAL